MGDPALPSTDLGPVIDLTAHEKINHIIEEGKKEARLAYQGTVPKELSNGYFIPPTLFTDAPQDGILSQQENLRPRL